MKRNWKRLVGVLMVALLLMSFAGCGAAPSESMDSIRNEAASKDYMYDSIEVPGQTVEEGLSSSLEKPVNQNQKLIRTMTLEAETDDLDGLLASLDAKIFTLGGYVENRNVRNGGSYSGRSYRYAELTIRVPADQLDSFVEHIQGQSNVLSHQESADDVTLTYVATQSRVTALETEQTRLLELLAKAENMSDLLMIEERLTNVRTELEEVASLLRLYDNLVDYGTVKLSVTEVVEYTVTEEEQTVWQRISTGFAENMESLGNGLTELFIFLVVCIPYMIPIAVIGLGVFAFIKLYDRKRAKKKVPPKEEGPKGE